jgi:hypothetical protein
MADDYDIAVSVLRLACDVLKKLKADQIQQLVEGKANLAFLPSGAQIVVAGPDSSEVRASLDAMQSRHEVVTYLDRLKLKKPELVALARQLGISVVSKDTVRDVRQKIIELTVGARADAAAIRSQAWKN